MITHMAKDDPKARILERTFRFVVKNANKNSYTMSHRARRHLRIDELPGNLSEALDELEKSTLRAAPDGVSPGHAGR